MAGNTILILSINNTLYTELANKTFLSLLHDFCQLFKGLVVPAQFEIHLIALNNTKNIRLGRIFKYPQHGKLSEKS